jgi:hypothetical protein
MSSCSNSGYGQLSAYFNGEDVVFKESPNDLAGDLHFKPTGIAPVAGGKSLNIYPNPTKDNLYIAKNTGVLQYRITDIAGRQLLSGECKAMINTASLPSGVYLLNIGGTFRKFVKQ